MRSARNLMLVKRLMLMYCRFALSARLAFVPVMDVKHVYRHHASSITMNCLIVWTDSLLGKRSGQSSSVLGVASGIGADAQRRNLSCKLPQDVASIFVF
mmetsp:Transcript_116499/g.290920  ORF Transcript_116499/g.290920 Transcript_116499/m.290920 type:complete len:99 (+) Transcript_116499:672-968(+)